MVCACTGPGSEENHCLRYGQKSGCRLAREVDNHEVQRPISCRRYFHHSLSGEVRLANLRENVITRSRTVDGNRFSIPTIVTRTEKETDSGSSGTRTKKYTALSPSTKKEGIFQQSAATAISAKLNMQDVRRRRVDPTSPSSPMQPNQSFVFPFLLIT